MRNYPLLLILLLLCGSTMAQTLDKSLFRKEVRGDETTIRQVAATMTSTNFYVAGMTMDLTFTLELTNTDNEFGDSLSITFPTGITPNSSPDDPFPSPISFAQAPEALNGVSGQTISWGDNDDDFGGIEPGNVIAFTVNVTIGAGVMGVQTIDYHVSGDMFGPSPADFNGTVTVNPLPAGPNGILSDSTFEAMTEIGAGGTAASFTLSNSGGGALMINSVTSTNPEVTHDLVATMVAAGGSQPFTVTYTPADLQDDVDTVVISTNDGTFNVYVFGFPYGNGVELEDFEVTTLFPSCQWGLNDADGDSSNWFAYPFSPHSGALSAASASWLGGTVLFPDNYLISPQLTPSATANFFAWWTAAQDPNFPTDFYTVSVSTTGTDPADFTDMLWAETLADDVWRSRRVDLTPYIGMNIYVAFRHYNVSDQFIMKVDDVRHPPKTTPDAQLPALGVNFQVADVPCPDDNTGAIIADVTGGGGTFLYIWSSGDTIATSDTTTFASGLSVGSYTLSIEDNCGATFSATEMVEALNDLDDASFQYPWDVLCKMDNQNIGPAITGVPGGTFTATPAGLVFENASTGKIDVGASNAGTYIVTYTTNGFCPNTATTTIIIDEACSHTAIEELSDQGITIYPNPSEGQFFIHNQAESRDVKIEVYNLQGQVLYQENTFLAEHVQHEISLPNVVSGMYLVKVSSEDQVGIQQIWVR